MKGAGLPIGVSVLCPGWVRTQIVDADRNWPAELGEKPAGNPINAVIEGHLRRAIDEGATPAFVADKVYDAVASDEYWVIPQQEFFDIVIERWASISERNNPVPSAHTPGMPPREQIAAEIMAALGMTPPAD